MKTIRQIRVIVIIFIVFCVCWAPYSVILLSDEFDVFPLSVHLYASMIAHLHASISFFVYGLTNKGLRAGYHVFVARRIFGLCCASVASNRAACSSDTTATRSLASGRSFDFESIRTSKPSRKTVVNNPTAVVMNELPNQSHNEHIEGGTTSFKETICADCVQTTDQQQQCSDSEFESDDACAETS